MILEMGWLNNHEVMADYHRKHVNLLTINQSKVVYWYSVTKAMLLSVNNVRKEIIKKRDK